MKQISSTTFPIKATLSVYLMLLLFLAGCGSSLTDEGMEVYPAGEAFGTTPEIIQLDDFADSFTFIPLETTDDILLTHINNIFEVDDKLIITHNIRCSVFDKNGKYLHDISSRGNGPNEYNGINDAFIQDGLVHLFDYSAKKIRAFTPDGTFSHEINTPYSYNTIRGAYNNLFAGYISNTRGNIVNKIEYFTTEGLLVDSIMNHQLYELSPNNVTVMFVNSGGLYNFDNKKYFRELYNDTLYTLLPDNTLQPRFVMDMGKYKLTPEFRYSLTMETFTSNNNQIFVDRPMLVLAGETNSHLLYSTQMNMKETTLYLDKKTKKVHHAHIVFTDKAGDEYEFLPRFVSADGKRIFSYYTPEESEDNPTLVIAHFNN